MQRLTGFYEEKGERLWTDIMPEEDIICHIWLNELPGIGPVTVRLLLREYKTVRRIYFEACHRTLTERKSEGAFPDIPASRLQPIQENTSLGRAELIFSECERRGIGIVTIEEPVFPDRLRAIADAPVLMYYRGHIESALNREMSTAGIVGSRRCERCERAYAARLAERLTEEGISIVSGMAKGIDACGHTACVNSGGYTIAVLGNGPDICYPREHDRLMERIAECGLILSEYPPGTPPHSCRFPARNRIIAALSDELHVIGAGRRSGAMITADFARAYGRRVFIYERKCSWDGKA